MEIQLPQEGCNIFYGSYVNNFTNDGRTVRRYYINENKLILSTTNTSQYSQLPSGYHCLSSNELIYKPEFDVYFPFLAGCLCVLVWIIIYKVIIKRLLP